jgi:diacylglycerol kinase family enzyme
MTLWRFAALTLIYMTYKNILYIYNPHSNEGRARKNWEKVTKQYPSVEKSAYDFTEIKDLSIFLGKKKPDLLVIGAGDGTINTVCEIVLQLKQKITLAIIPLGFGNAMAYCFGVETIEKAMKTILHPKKTVTIDLMRTNIPHMPIGLFTISAGFDARVVHTRMNHSYIPFRSYLLSAIPSFFSHPNRDIIFTVDHAVTLNATISSIMVANGPILGQNYLVAPAANLNDGLLDCTVFSTKYAYIRNLRPRGFKHPFYSKTGKIHFKASHIRIEGEPFVQVDGDPVIQSRGVEIEVLKQAITFLYSEDIDTHSPTLGFTM